VTNGEQHKHRKGDRGLMSELVDFSSREGVEHLPPLERAPILQKLVEVGQRRFLLDHAVPTPVDPDTGVVDHEKLIDTMLELVDPEYKWQAPFFDEHHLHWFAHRYSSAFHPDVKLTNEFRNLSIHKIWVPRQFHNFIHAVTIPPEVPEPEAMRRSVKEFRRNRYIHKITTHALSLYQRQQKMVRYDNRGDIIYLDPETKDKTRNIEAFGEWRREFVHHIETNHRRGLIDLSVLTSLEVVNVDTISESLAEIKALMDEGLVRRRGRAALNVRIPIDTGFEESENVFIENNLKRAS